MFNPIALPPLPGPSVLDTLLFESVWMGPAALGLLGLVVFAVFNARGKGSTGLLAFGVALALAGSVAALSLVVETDREALRDRTRAVVAAVASADGPGLRGLVFDRVWLRDIPTLPDEADRETLIELVERSMRGIAAVDQHRVREVQATTDSATVARTHVLVWVRTANAGVPINSAWRLDWQRPDPETPWRLAGIELIELDGYRP